MNRTLILGIAMFLAIVGIALVGGEKVAVAGHGCHCCCCGGCCGGCCCGGCHCHGDHRHRCCCGGDAAVVEIAAAVARGCCGGSGEAAPAHEDKAPPAPAGMTKLNSDRAPFAFSKVSYRR